MKTLFILIFSSVFLCGLVPVQKNEDHVKEELYERIEQKNRVDDKKFKQNRSNFAKLEAKKAEDREFNRNENPLPQWTREEIEFNKNEDSFFK